MKQHHAYGAFWLVFLLLLTAKRAQAQPGWGIDPAPYQYSMTLVAQIQVDGAPNHQTANHLAAFSNGRIRGYATPVTFSGQAFYFMNLFSNRYQNDTLYLRAFMGADQKVYESADSIIFRHHQALGSVGTPVQIHLHLGDRPLIYSLPEVNYTANTCSDILDVQATDKQNSEGNGLTYSISGGPDASRFGISAQTGLLSWFNFTPDYAMPQDAGFDNRYEVDVKVTDASNLVDVQHVAVTVVPTGPPLPPLLCPPDISLLSDSDGAGNCGATTGLTAIPLSTPCEAGLLSYEMWGATVAAGAGLVPPGQVFSVGQTTVYYFRAGGECPFTVTVADNEPPTVNCPANLTVSPTVFNPCSAMVGSIDATFGDNCSGASLAFTCSGATGGGGGGQASGQVFLAGNTTVTYTAADGAGLSTTCSFTVTVNNCNTVFSGFVKWEHDGVSGVQSAAVSLAGAATGSAATDVNGFYQITLPYTAGNFTLKPAKNTNKLNGVTTADVTAIQQHVANSSLLPAPFKRIAADVNKSNSITALDATLLNQALLGNQSALNQISSWRFVPSAYIFPNPNIPWGFPEQIDLTGASGQVANQNFKGIKLGDVVSTWANPANFGAGEPLVWSVQDQLLEKGREYFAVFQTARMADPASFQFALQFDPDQVELIAIDPLPDSPLRAEHFGTFNAPDGEIRVVWSQAESLYIEEGTPLFRLRLKARQNGARLSEALRLNDDALPGHVYNSVYAESDVRLQFWSTTGTGQAGALPAALEVQPNPFVDATTLILNLPAETDAELRVLDAAGRVLFSEKRRYAAGKHARTLRLDGACGVLAAQLATRFGVLTQRLTAVKN